MGQCVPAEHSDPRTEACCKVASATDLPIVMRDSARLHQRPAMHRPATHQSAYCRKNRLPTASCIAIRTVDNGTRNYMLQCSIPIGEKQSAPPALFRNLLTQAVCPTAKVLRYGVEIYEIISSYNDKSFARATGQHPTDEYGADLKPLTDELRHTPTRQYMKRVAAS